MNEEDKAREEIKEAVAPWVAGRFVFGAIDEVNGPGAEEKDAKITRFEARLIVEHWAKQIKAIATHWAEGDTGSWEIRTGPYARYRISYLLKAELISKDELEELCDEVFQSRASDQGDSARIDYHEWI